MNGCVKVLPTLLFGSSIGVCTKYLRVKVFVVQTAIVDGVGRSFGHRFDLVCTQEAVPAGVGEEKAGKEEQAAKDLHGEVGLFVNCVVWNFKECKKLDRSKL